MADYDLAIIGGGINGAGIARDAAGRGLRVLLVEQNDLASGTSSASTKLIHGGLRYLEHGAFRLVREALIEREVLLRMAPHLIRPMRFVLPAAAGPALAAACCGSACSSTTISAARKILPRDPQPSISPITSPAQPLQAALPLRLRVFRLLGRRCAPRRAQRARCRRARRHDPHPHARARAPSASDDWRLILNARGRREVVTARVLVNAAGPWVGIVSRNRAAHRAGRAPRAARQGQPYRGAASCSITTAATSSRTPTSASCSRCRSSDDFTLIGTTDENFHGDPLDVVAPSADEIDLSLRRRVSEYFREPVDAGRRWSGPSPACARSTTTAPAKPEDVDARLSSRRSTSATATRRCSRSMAARSRPIGRLAEAALAKLAHFFQLQPALDRARRRCRAATFPGTASRRTWRRRCAPGRS